MAHKTNPQPSAIPPEGGAAAASDTAPPPPFGTPKPLVDAGGPVPRIVPELTRAPNGLKRFKIRCVNNSTPQAASKYVLAADEADAKACYLLAQKLDDAAVLSVVTLAD